MKSLVDEIVRSRESRHDALDGIHKDVRALVHDAKALMTQFSREGKERKQDIKAMANGVKEFLATSNTGRMKVFQTAMEGVRASLIDVRKDSRQARAEGRRIVKDAQEFLGNLHEESKKRKSEVAKILKESVKTLQESDGARKKDFVELRGRIKNDITAIARRTASVQEETRAMLRRFSFSRETAKRHWASLSKKEAKSEHPKKEEKKEAGESAHTSSE